MLALRGQVRSLPLLTMPSVGSHQPLWPVSKLGRLAYLPSWPKLICPLRVRRAFVPTLRVRLYLAPVMSYIRTLPT